MTRAVAGRRSVRGLSGSFVDVSLASHLDLINLCPCSRALVKNKCYSDGHLPQEHESMFCSI